MMIVNARYFFLPPNGHPDRPLTVLALQDYSPGRRQQQQVDVWQIERPLDPACALPLGDHLEFSSYGALISALAKIFCQGDEAVAAQQLILRRARTERPKV
jgi:hypothetical protein